MTKGQESVRAALAEARGFRSAQEIYANLREAGSKIGLTTVYRALQALSDAGEVDTLQTAAGESAYRACVTEQHHHHLVCRVCGRTEEVSEPAVERWAARIGAEHGFHDVTHVVEIFGTCGACGQRQ